MLVTMSYNRRGGTNKHLNRAGRGKMKGDASVWRASHFRINVRCATASVPLILGKWRRAY
jgi:hypothetical protein